MLGVAALSLPLLLLPLILPLLLLVLLFLLLPPLLLLSLLLPLPLLLLLLLLLLLPPLLLLLPSLLLRLGWHGGDRAQPVDVTASNCSSCVVWLASCTLSLLRWAAVVWYRWMVAEVRAMPVAQEFRQWFNTSDIGGTCGGQAHCMSAKVYATRHASAVL